MGIIKDVVSGITGGKAAKRAANAQAAAAKQAAQRLDESKERALDLTQRRLLESRGDLQSFTDVGRQVLPQLQQGVTDVNRLVTDPNEQLSFVQDNPFFEALAKRATDKLFNFQGSRGKAFSGGTAEALQNSLLLLGNDLVSENVGQRLNVNNQFQNIANLGFNAATNQASLSDAAASRDVGTITGTATNVANLRTQEGSVQASGIIGKEQAYQNAANNAESRLIDAAKFAVQLCDRRAKENIKRVGTLENGLPLYEFNYIGDNKKQINVMAQDVEKVIPEAVIEIDGLKLVDMEQVWL